VSYKVGVALSQKFDRSSQISVKTEQSSTKDFLVPYEKFLFVACFNVLSVSHLINVLIAPSLYNKKHLRREASRPRRFELLIWRIIQCNKIINLIRMCFSKY
jgi:hypothetical protein